MENAAIILNGKASRAARNKKRLLELASKSGISKKNTHWVEKPAEIPSRIQEILKSNPKKLLIAGGDGTIVSTIEQAIESGYNGVFSVIPAGTSNYLARNLNIPLKFAAAFELAGEGEAKEIHLGEANGKVFLLMADIGVTAQVSEHVSVALKKRIGQLAYAAEAIRQTVKKDSFEYSIKTTDGKNDLSGRGHQIVVANANLTKQLKIIPTASIHDPQLRVIVFETKHNYLNLVFSVLLSVITFGRVQRGIKDFFCEAVEIRTKPPESVSVDGEVSGETPLLAQMHDHRPKIVVPES